MYKIIGADQKEYGPISADELRQWIREGRVNGQTQVQAAGGEWRPLSQYPEFAGNFAKAPPAFGPAANQDGRQKALQKVNAPGIALIAATGVAMGLTLIMLLGDVMGMSMGLGTRPGMDPEMARMARVWGGTIGFGFRALQILVGVFIILAGIKMRQLKGHGLCMVAGILALIPCVAPCCIFTLPFGIWALVVLSQPQVKEHFS